jgi:hypothetical protein
MYYTYFVGREEIPEKVEAIVLLLKPLTNSTFEFIIV